jgi:hypothetical protein
MTATGVFHALTATIDALRHGRFSAAPPSPVPAQVYTAPLIEMACPRCGHSVKATVPPDEDEAQDLAFQCTGCGVAACWI